MKKLIFLSLCSVCLIIVLESFAPLKIMRKDGTDPGYTGSPGDSLKNCTFCHGGTATPIAGWITSTIPASGYVPGQRYTITATNTEDGGTRFGFEVSPQDPTGKLLGTMVITDASRTKLVGDSKYITYTANGVDGQGLNSWTFDWIAPAKGTGEVVFYGAFNSNFEGHKDGDKTFLSTLKVKEAGTTGISDIPNKLFAIAIYPNPAKDYLQVNFEVKTASNVIIDVIDLAGKQITILMNSRLNNGVFNKQFDINSLSEGNYLVRINADGASQTHKITIQK